MSIYIRSVLWDLNIPPKTVTITYEENNACTAMANAQNPTPRTHHMDIKYFALHDLVEQDLICLEQIDTKFKLANPFTKTLQCASFHRHVDFILRHVPPQFSPVYSKHIGTYTDQHTDIDEYVPGSFTTPLCPAAAWINALIWKNYFGNPWIRILWHGKYNPTLSLELWGGVIV
jgi:hypothetical protein